MTIITSGVGICNMALGFLKLKPITNIDTPTTNEEKICAQYYDVTRQAVLQSADWSFAIKRAIVAEDSSTPSFGWDHQSGTLPSDYLKLISFHDSNGRMIINTNDACYEIEGNKILSDESGPYYIRYIADITDENKFDALFKMNLAYALATVMSEAFKSSATTLQIILKKWQEIWEDTSKTVNSQQFSIKRITRAPYIEARVSPERGNILNYEVE